MNAMDGLDLSALSQFKAADLLTGEAGCLAPGAPVQVALDRIDLDPAQPRRSVRADGIEELAESIRRHGVLEPVSLRCHPEQADRYIVNRGERRVRASRRAGLSAVPAFVDERVDPFAQAAENLHREDMSPLDLSAFIAEREREGHSRAEIARRLGKPRSFITEAARLGDAPAQLRWAVEEGRIGGDVRVLYRLVAIARDRPQEFQELLARGAPISRAHLDETMARPRPCEPDGSPAPPAGESKVAKVTSSGRTVLVVEHGGRRGSLRLKAQDNNVGEVRFGDGTRSLLPLADLRPVCWATEE
ncbi:chromosome partitioning protein, ParB family [Variovorax sp. YR752]|uniref:ParB/RepB/Spo0J family partition protein n=1 Tax=unclassified Variovorax TaxID=663243 RepID=UPI000BC8DC05|nr:ParB/RepB/Spo0J family partition protein [Variovorax sp. YR752]SOE06356.1 chromosome partitioning protein, ParB family [Variovorax sp. YR752]